MPLVADDLLALAAPEAERRHLERLAHERVRLALPLFVGIAAVLFIASLAEGGTIAAVAAALDVFLVVVAWRLLRRDEPPPRPLDLVAGLLLGQTAIFALIATDPGIVLALAGLLLPVAGLAFRFEAPQRLAVAAGGLLLGLVAVFVPGLLPALPQGAGGGGLAFVVAGVAAGAWLGRLRTRRELDRFRPLWARDAGRERERTTLRREMDAARVIQLGMLPRSAPSVAGLDVAGASLPASQVGGDYFDYLPLPDGRLAVVVGDVAGHGLASGLLLSGLRSCLRLLRDDLDRPADVLARLDGVVAEGVERRLLVTLLVAVLDPVRRELRVAAAGHPPVLLVRRGELIEIAEPAPPLGTRLPHRFVEARTSLEPGDLLVLASDGLLEARSPWGEFFGDGFAEALGQAAAGGESAQAICDALLAEVASHRGETPQEDDLTLVVVRVGEGAVPGPSLEN